MKRKVIYFVIVLLFTSGVCLADDSEVYPQLSLSGDAVIVAKSVSPVPTGIYVMVRSPSILNNKDKIVKILNNSWVNGIAIGLHWDCFFPTNGNISSTCLDEVLNKITVASSVAGRDDTVPTFLKLYPLLPKWMGSTCKDTEVKFTTNKVGMGVLRIPSKVNSSGKVIDCRDHPIPTDKVYLNYLKLIIEHTGNWLLKADPETRIFPIIHYFAPGMSSNQMRPIYLDKFPNTGKDKFGANWTKKAHIDAWGSLAKIMGDHEGYSNRVWVFNFTALPPGILNTKFSLTSYEQEQVKKQLDKFHPAGAVAVFSKSEDMTVEFHKTKSGLSAKWREKYKDKNFPYQYVASQCFRHGWELWASFSPERDARAGYLYPLNELLTNSILLDMNSSSPSVPQGTVWIEIWESEVLKISNKKGSNKKYDNLNELFLKWNRMIRENLLSSKMNCQRMFDEIKKNRK